MAFKKMLLFVKCIGVAWVRTVMEGSSVLFRKTLPCTALRAHHPKPIIFLPFLGRQLEQGGGGGDAPV